MPAVTFQQLPSVIVMIETGVDEKICADMTAMSQDVLVRETPVIRLQRVRSRPRLNCVCSLGSLPVQFARVLRTLKSITSTQSSHEPNFCVLRGVRNQGMFSVSDLVQQVLAQNSNLQNNISPHFAKYHRPVMCDPVVMFSFHD